MRSNTDAPTKVANDEIQIFVLFVDAMSIAPGNGPVVQSMPYAYARHKWRATYTCKWRKFIDYARIGYKGPAVLALLTVNHIGNLVGYQTSKIAGVIMHDATMDGVLKHAFVDFVNSAFYGFY